MVTSIPEMAWQRNRNTALIDWDMRTDVNITIDLDELFDGLRQSEQIAFIKQHLDVLSINDITEFLEDDGYKVVK